MGSELVERLWQDLIEKDDRTSPAEYPDMALITFDEFKLALSAQDERREWMPIETAPRDGTEFLACSAHEEMGGNFMQVVHCDISDSHDSSHGWWIVDADCAFTHWRPLPSMPEGSKRDG